MPDTGFIILNYNTYEHTARNVDIFIEHNKSVFVAVVDNLSPNGDYDKLVQHYAASEQVMVVQAGENGGRETCTSQHDWIQRMIINERK